jgi:hypothetical protein
MKALLQDGLQVHIPAPPEKRLLINQLEVGRYALDNPPLST